MENAVTALLQKIPSLSRIESRVAPEEGLKNPGGRNRGELVCRILSVPLFATEDRGDFLRIYENEIGR
jgi:hypothetical protein